jgi:hypothetical protein
MRERHKLEAKIERKIQRMREKEIQRDKPTEISGEDREKNTEKESNR